MKDEEWILLVQNLGPKLFRFFLSSSSKVVAEDSVQEVFLRLLRRTRKVSSEGAPKNIEAFAWGIAVLVRKELRRNDLRLRRESPLERTDLDRMIDPVSEVEDLSPEINALRQALLSLEEPQREIMELVMSDMKISEISAVLDMPEGTVKSHIYRAKEKLQAKLRTWGFL